MIPAMQAVYGRRGSRGCFPRSCRWRSENRGDAMRVGMLRLHENFAARSSRYAQDDNEGDLPLLSSRGRWRDHGAANRYDGTLGGIRGGVGAGKNFLLEVLHEV